MQRRSVHYSGDVQGVGFRYTTAGIARGFAVSGFVRNLPDGRVELVVEGLPDALDDFLAAIRERFESNIREERSAEAAATGEFERFEIRR